MTASTVKVPTADLVKQVEVRLEVTGLRMARWRLTAGAWLLRFAAWVGGFTAVLEQVQKPVVVDDRGIPSRMDVRTGDVDWSIAKNVEVCLYGEPVRTVIAYDTQEGWLERYAEDSSGKVLIVDGDLVPQRIYGQVTVDWRDEVPA